jgi:hypothetical protein
MRFPTLTQTISRTAGDLLEQWKQRGLGSDVILPDEIRQQRIQFRGGMRRRNAGFQPDDRSIVEAAGWFLAFRVEPERLENERLVRGADRNRSASEQTN